VKRCDLTGVLSLPASMKLKEAAALLARLGGRARARKLSAKRRRQIARKAAKTRWAKRRKKRGES
jgi:hypothetical protein